MTNLMTYPTQTYLGTNSSDNYYNPNRRRSSPQWVVHWDTQTPPIWTATQIPVAPQQPRIEPTPVPRVDPAPVPDVEGPPEKGKRKYKL